MSARVKRKGHRTMKTLFKKGDQVLWNWAGGTFATIVSLDNTKAVIRHLGKDNKATHRATVFLSSLKLVKGA